MLKLPAISIYTSSNSRPLDLCMVETVTFAPAISQKSSNSDSKTNSLKSVKYFFRFVCSNTSRQRQRYGRVLLEAYLLNSRLFDISQTSSGMMGVLTLAPRVRMKYLTSASELKWKPSEDWISFALTPRCRSNASRITASSLVCVSNPTVPSDGLETKSRTSGMYIFGDAKRWTETTPENWLIETIGVCFNRPWMRLEKAFAKSTTALPLR